jgi:hypothetical protein
LTLILIQPSTPVGSVTLGQPANTGYGYPPYPGYDYGYGPRPGPSAGSLASEIASGVAYGIGDQLARGYPPSTGYGNGGPGWGGPGGWGGYGGWRRVADVPEKGAEGETLNEPTEAATPGTVAAPVKAQESDIQKLDAKAPEPQTEEAQTHE